MLTNSISVISNNNIHNNYSNNYKGLYYKASIYFFTVEKFEALKQQQKQICY